MKKLLMLVLTAAVLCTAACKEKEDKTAVAAQPEKKVETRLMGNASVYEGTLPCADCEGIKTKLTLTYYLNGDYEYTKEETYLGKNSKPFVTTSAWSENLLMGRVTLYNASGTDSEYWQRKGKDTLVKLDMKGNPIKSNLNYSLKQTAKLQGL
ncbi:putative lipoprotein NlpE involved in copper resistance [Elusimicrobium posterum]|uniref:copper resistance protein NlpE n=1 Tax=Elusimicrobium posterum TaxID=3116653 RepID=UPI003C7898B0